jgi:hypothetical protein
LIALPLAALGVAAAVVALRRTEPAPISAALAAPAPGAAPSRVRAHGQLGPGRGTIVIALEPPAGAELTPGGPLVVQGRGEHLTFPERIKKPLDPGKLPLRLPVDVTDGALGPARIQLAYHWCTKGNAAACRPERVELEVDLDLSGDAPGGEAFFTHRATP